MKTKEFFVVFGVTWLGTLMIFSAMYSILTGESIFSFFNNFPLTMFFLLIGITILGIGIYKIIKDLIVSINGEECYGRILSINETGTIIDGDPVLMAEILVYIPSLNETKIIMEDIGTDSTLYSIDDAVKVKYYKDDITILNLENKSVLSMVVEQALYSEIITNLDE